MKRTFVLRNPAVLDRLIDALRALNLELKAPWSVQIQPHVERRNLEQNARYWAAVQDIARHVGHPPDDIHEICKLKFLAPKVLDLPDGDYTFTRSTTGLNTREMSQLIDEVQAWGAGLGVEWTQ